MEMTIYEKLSMIQNEMNVPKNMYNTFGKYYYRNAETILDTAKPICKKYRTTLTVSDEIFVSERGWTYVVGVATLFDWDSDKSIVNKAFAREEESKKGMDASQVTGSCSSYARKYALNGLFNLDDVKDADAEENNAIKKSDKKTDSNSLGSSTKEQHKRLRELCDETALEKYCRFFQVSSIEELSYDKANSIISQREKTVFDTAEKLFY